MIDDGDGDHGDSNVTEKSLNENFKVCLVVFAWKLDFFQSNAAMFDGLQKSLIPL
jgi:hypothetical protein